MNAPNDTDLLLNRVVGRDDGPGDWRILREHAQQDPDLWPRLADELEDDMLVRAAVAERGDPAASVALPGTGLRRLPRPTGWIAAAVLALLWIGGVRMPWTTETAPEPDPAVAAAPARDVVELGELPRVVVSTSDVAEDGSVEVVYVRRVLERTRVQDVQTIGVDELGLPFATEHPAALIATPRSM